MNGFDIIIGIIIGIIVLRGFMTGVVKQVASLAILLFGGWFAKFLVPFAASLFSSFDIPPPVIHIIAYIISFILVAIVLLFFANLLTKVVKNIGLSFLNSLGGMLVGLFTALLISSLLINVIVFTDKDGWFVKEQTREDSLFFGRLEGIAPAVFPYIKQLYEQNYPHLNEQEQDTEVASNCI